MMVQRWKFRLAAACALGALPLFAQIELGTPFTDGVVLQRGMKVPVWGRVLPDAKGLLPPSKGGPKIVLPGKRKITVAFAGQEKTVESDAFTGCWKVELDPMEASKESRTLTVTEKKPGFLFDSTASSVEIKDVLVGEVWFAAGQSNMELQIVADSPRSRDGNGLLLTSMARLPYVRFAKNRKTWSVAPTNAAYAGWQCFEPASFAIVKSPASALSALAFYYARELYLALDVPIGIVDSSWGGTNIDAWTPRCGYEGCNPIIRGTADYEVRADWKKPEIPGFHGPICDAKQQPTVIFNAMVASWTPMAMRGMIWYQGEHNAAEAHLYGAKMRALYRGWAQAFANPKLKLYFAELAPFGTNWMYDIIRAQHAFAASEPNAEIASTSDVGNFDDVHPNDKETVAQRLAVHALKRDYGFDIDEDRSPEPRSAEFGEGKAHVFFDHAKSLYVYAADRSVRPPFELMGTNGVWTLAKVVNAEPDGRLKGEGIVLACDGIGKVSRVRYMGMEREMSTVYNQRALPLGPFELAAPDAPSLKPILVFNEDDSAYFSGRKYGGPMTEKGLRDYIRNLSFCDKVTHFFMCPNAQCCNFDSKVMTTAWDAIRRPGVKARDFQCNVAKLHEMGIDPYAVWADECRIRGISPWLTIRMNDVHFANDPTDSLHSEFRLKHPELWRVPHDASGNWNSRALDYAHQEVRDYFKAFLAEAFARYDIDGVELDWMRFGHNLTPGRERELSGCIDEVVCEARRLADEAAKRLGHAVKVGVRLPSRPEEAIRRGNDYVKWAKEGWIDWIVPCNFWQSVDFGIPYCEWTKAVAGAKRPVTVVPGMDNGVTWPGEQRRALTYDEYAAFADRNFSLGAPGTYIFNLFDQPKTNGVWQLFLALGLEPQGVAGKAKLVKVPENHD